MVTKVEKPVESRDAAIHRLAKQARDKGVQIMTYDPTREYFATSVSQPGTLHRVTVLSCDCVGFFRNQRCTHHAALLDHIGELPELPTDPTPAATMTGIEIVCEQCSGAGYDGNRPCKACRGRGKADITVSVVDLDFLDQYDLNQLRGVQCRICQGDGYRQVSTGGRLSDWEASPCVVCQAAGLVPVPAHVFPAIAA